jgi:hypothetical protein
MSKRMRWVEHGAFMAKKRNAYRIFVGKLEGKMPPGKHKCRWEDNIKMILREVGWAIWTGFTWFRKMALVKMAMNLQVP